MADEHFVVKTILGNGRWEGMFPRTERMVPCCVERCVRFAWRNKGGGELCRSVHAVLRIRRWAAHECSLGCDEKYERGREFRKTHGLPLEEVRG